MSYEFDDRGNWIKRSTRRSNQDNPTSPAQITDVSHRQIIYFGPPTPSGAPIAKFTSSDKVQLKTPIQPNEENLDRGRTLVIGGSKWGLENAVIK